MKLLHLPNDPSYEDIANRQNGPRDAFEKFHHEGLLSGYDVFQFLAEYRRSKDAKAVKDEILDRARTMQPDIIFWHHIGNVPVDQKFFDDLRDASQSALLVYHEGDPFGRRFKKINPYLRIILSNADVVFSIALGKLAELMRENGARDLRYLPHCYDQARFGKPWEFGDRRAYKLSMIANCGSTRIPGRYFPGGRNRLRLARRLSRNYGTEFALYGRGWSNLVSARGRVAFDRQEEAIRDSWVSVNWDHFDELAHYFSDRLPISLAAGVAHVTSYHEGYEDMFTGCPGLYTAKTVDEAVTKVDWMLSRSHKQLIEDGRGAYEWVKGRLDAETIYRHAIDLCAEKIADGARS